MSVKLKPRLRFSEFKSELRKLKARDVFSIFNGYAFSSNDSTVAGVRWLKIADVGIQKIKHDNLSYLPKHYEIQYSKFTLKKGDVVIALTRPVLGKKLKISIIDDETKGALLNQRVGKLQTAENLFYVYYLMQCNRVITSIVNSISGTDPPNLAPTEINHISISIGNAIEQQKIADFLTSVDDKISQLSKKQTLLTTYKKGVKQQLFSQQIRFKDENGNAFPDWEVHELATLSESGISNGVFNDPKKVGKGYRLINVKDMYKGDSIEYEELTLLDLDTKSFERNKVKYGDIFFTRSSIVPAGIAFSNVNLSENEDITFDGHLMKISPDKKRVVPLFLAYYLRSYYPRKALVSRGKQSTMTTIAQDDIKDIKLNIPTVEEQQKIAEFLQSIDNKISAVTVQIEQSKVFKKGLLQQMFV